MAGNERRGDMPAEMVPLERRNPYIEEIDDELFPGIP